MCRATRSNTPRLAFSHPQSFPKAALDMCVDIYVSMHTHAHMRTCQIQEISKLRHQRRPPLATRLNSPTSCHHPQPAKRRRPTLGRESQADRPALLASTRQREQPGKTASSSWTWAVMCQPPPSCQPATALQHDETGRDGEPHPPTNQLFQADACRVEPISPPLPPGVVVLRALHAS